MFPLKVNKQNSNFPLQMNKKNIQSVIPLNLYQTWYTLDLPPKMKENVELIKQQNNTDLRGKRSRQKVLHQTSIKILL